MHRFMEFVRKLLWPTKEERIAWAKKIYRNNPPALAEAIFQIKGVVKIRDPEEQYRAIVDICAEYNLDYTIPN